MPFWSALRRRIMQWRLRRMLRAATQRGNGVWQWAWPMTEEPAAMLTALAANVRAVLPRLRTPDGIDQCRLLVQQVTMTEHTMLPHSRTHLLDFTRQQPTGLDTLAVLVDRLPPPQGTHWVGVLISLGDAVAD